MRATCTFCMVFGLYSSRTLVQYSIPGAKMSLEMRGNVLCTESFVVPFLRFVRGCSHTRRRAGGNHKQGNDDVASV
jgi:hypothetical protein